MMNNQTQVFADGETIVFLVKDELKASYALTIKNPLLYSFQTDFPMGIENTYILGKDNPISIEQSFPIVDINMHLKAKAEDVIQEASDGEILINLDIFKKVSVSNMFKIINKKIKKRSKKLD